LAVGGLGYVGYSARVRMDSLEGELNTSNGNSATLSKELDQTNQRVAVLRSQLDVASQKLGLTQAELSRARAQAEQLAQEQKEGDAKIAAQIGQVQQENEAKFGQVSNDITGTKSDIASTRKDLEDTKSRLTKAVGDLTGQGVLIARNGEELEALKRLNDRNIYDFKLTKSKNPQHVGPIQVLLKSTDPKKYKFSMTVIADDKSIEKKDRTANEPMQFYVRGAHAPYEMVVFEVTKDGATGYLSTPKEVASAAPAPAPGGTARP